MAFSFKQVALQQTQLSRLMEGRNKMDTEDIIKAFPDGVTIEEFDMITIDGKEFPVLTIKEDSSVFFFGGAILGKICYAWMKETGKSAQETSELLKADGGVKVKLGNSKTKGGRSLTTVELL